MNGNSKPNGKTTIAIVCVLAGITAAAIGRCYTQIGGIGERIARVETRQDDVAARLERIDATLLRMDAKLDVFLSANRQKE